MAGHAAGRSNGRRRVNGARMRKAKKRWEERERMTMLVSECCKKLEIMKTCSLYRLEDELDAILGLAPIHSDIVEVCYETYSKQEFAQKSMAQYEELLSMIMEYESLRQFLEDAPEIEADEKAKFPSSVEFVKNIAKDLLEIYTNMRQYAENRNQKIKELVKGIRHWDTWLWEEEETDQEFRELDQYLEDNLVEVVPREMSELLDTYSDDVALTEYLLREARDKNQ